MRKKNCTISIWIFAKFINCSREKNEGKNVARKKKEKQVKCKIPLKLYYSAVTKNNILHICVHLCTNASHKWRFSG